MNSDTLLLAKRSELKEAISKGLKNTFPAYFYNAIGHGFAKIFRLKKQPHWSFSVFVLYILLLLPGPLIAWGTGEIYRWGVFELILYGSGTFLYLGSVVAYINVVQNILPGIRDHIVDSIQSVESLDQLEKWLIPIWSISKWSIFSLGASLVFGILIIGIENQLAGRFVGIGVVVSTFLLTMPIWTTLYPMLRMLAFPIEMASCQLDLYESDPANSEIVQRLVYILNISIYLISGYCAVGTMIGALVPELSWSVWLYIFLGWTPTIIQFLVNQYAIRKIIIDAKWRNLNKLQAQIKELQNNNLITAPETTFARLNQLMDLHDRIGAKPNSILNWGSGLSFLNQLMLPLLGLLLGNIDKLLKLINP